MITIPTPHVPHGPKGIPANVADAEYLRSAVRNIEHLGRGEKLWGSNVTATVIKMLGDAADALETVDDALAALPQAAPTSEGEREKLTEIIATYGAHRVQDRRLPRSAELADDIIAAGYRLVQLPEGGADVPGQEWWITDGGYFVQGRKPWAGPYRTRETAFNSRARLEAVHPTRMTYCIDSCPAALPPALPTAAERKLEPCTKEDCDECDNQA